MRRRELFPLLAALGLAPAVKEAPADPPVTSAFDAAIVRNLARELARLLFVTHEVVAQVVPQDIHHLFPQDFLLQHHK